MTIQYTKHAISQADHDAITDVLNSGWISGGGEYTTWLEDALAATTGYKHAIVCNSGTSALHLAYLTVFGKKVHISLPTLTMVATASPIVHTGNLPLLEDVDEHTLVNDKFLDVTVDYAGFPTKNGTVIDAAQSLRPDMNLGYAIAVCVSLHATKGMTTGEGGVVLTDHEDIAELCKSLRDHGRNEKGECVYPGYNFRLPDLNCALGLSQLTSLGENIRRRREIAAYYNSSLIPGGLRADEYPLRLPASHPKHVYHLYVIRVKKNRDLFRKELEKQGVGSQIHYKCVHLQPWYQKKFGYSENEFPVATKAYQEMVSIPIFASMTDEETETVVKAVRKAIEVTQ